MFKIPVVLIDNLQEELDKLTQGFALAGIPCVPIKYENSHDRTGINYINIDATNVRIIATDINLTDLTTSLNATSVYENIGNVIKKINPKGPYCLIFWSQHNDLPDEIIRLLKERMSDDINPPIAWGILDKKDFRAGDGALIAPNPESIFKIIRKSPVMEPLMMWESRINMASSNTLYNLYELALDAKTKGWDAVTTHGNLCTLLTHIAHQAVGNENVFDEPNQAIEIGLLPVLEDRLSFVSKGPPNEIDDKWRASLLNLGKNEKTGLPTLSSIECSKLNTFYNIDSQIKGASKTGRGIFLSVSDNLFGAKRKLSLKKGSMKISRFSNWRVNDKKNEIFGNYDYPKIIQEEFAFFGNELEKKQTVSDTVLGWLEIGAICDHAQRKNRMHRYLLGALTSVDDVKKISENLKHEGIYRFPDIQLSGKRYIFQISFRFHMSAHADSKQLGNPIFRVKDQILNEVMFKWSNYSVRPGITGFWPPRK
jgi:hypothetical protein